MNVTNREKSGLSGIGRKILQNGGFSFAFGIGREEEEFLFVQLLVEADSWFCDIWRWFEEVSLNLRGFKGGLSRLEQVEMNFRRCES